MRRTSPQDGVLRLDRNRYYTHPSSFRLWREQCTDVLHSCSKRGLPPHGAEVPTFSSFPNADAGLVSEHDVSRQGRVVGGFLPRPTKRTNGLVGGFKHFSNEVSSASSRREPLCRPDVHPEGGLNQPGSQVRRSGGRKSLHERSSQTDDPGRDRKGPGTRPHFTPSGEGLQTPSDRVPDLPF